MNKRVLLDLGKANVTACNKNKQTPAAMAVKRVRLRTRDIDREGGVGVVVVVWWCGDGIDGVGPLLLQLLLLLPRTCTYEPVSYKPVCASCGARRRTDTVARSTCTCTPTIIDTGLVFTYEQQEDQLFQLYQFVLVSWNLNRLKLCSGAIGLSLPHRSAHSP